MLVVYEPKGAAREYAALAVNLYHGCDHGCIYCYVPGVMRKTKELFHGQTVGREFILDKLAKDCDKLQAQNCKDEIMLCFACDPYHGGDTKGQDCQTCNLGVEGMTWEQAQKQATLSVGAEFNRHKLAMKEGRKA